ncbi:hypothetical protein [Nocardia grenadensis]|uniref:hypothetical protein n=1 Tax=Nocardia grenadensis TaxID=931537 RepID=UPI0007A459A4|nr:hypothetical protein [Nocardia grenadensis]
MIVFRVFGREVFALGRTDRAGENGDITGAADLTGGSAELADYYPGRADRAEVTLSRRRTPARTSPARIPPAQFGFHG